MTGIATSLPPEPGLPGVPVPTPAGPGGSGTRPVRRTVDRSALVLHAAVVVGFVLLGVVLWWRVWIIGHPTTTISCQCGDPSQELWFLSWTPWAIVHGHNPFLSNLIYAGRGGANMVTNTSWMLPSVVLAPVTWLFGPIASFNVAATLAPALSGWCFFVAARRVTTFVPGQVLGGLLFGFSPFVLENDPFGHLNFTLLFFAPLVFVVLVDLLATHRRGPVLGGVLLGVLVVAEFFTSTEFLAMCGVAVAVALVAAVVLGPRAAWAQRRHAVVAAAVALAIAIVALAYPVWMVLAGPRHIVGFPWQDSPQLGTSPWAVVRPGVGVHVGSLFDRVGGYFGAVGPNAGPLHLPSLVYLGVPLVVLLVVSAVVWYRRRLAWVVAITTVVLWVFSFGTTLGTEAARAAEQEHPWWLPWRLFAHVPLVSDVLPIRFGSLVVFGAAMLLAISLDRWRTVAIGFAGRGHGVPGGPVRWAKPGAAVLVAVVGAASLLPVALAAPVPFTVVPTPLPAWFTIDAPELPAGTTVLVVPFAGQTSMGWQAQAGLSFALANGFAVVPGPTGRSEFVDPPGGVVSVLGQLSSQTETFAAPPLPSSPHDVALVRQAIDGWGVGAVVVTHVGREPLHSVAFFTAVFGRAPAYRHGVWEWRGRPGRQMAVTGAALTACGSGPSAAGDELAVPRCVLAVPGVGVVTALDLPSPSTGRVPSPDARPPVAGRRRLQGGWWARPTTFLLLAFVGYLAVSVALWWGVWSTHPTSVTVCGCGDTSLFTWWMDWPAYAIAHGHNPAFSPVLLPPHGINLLADTSVLAMGVPLAPVTWLFGPVATLNVALTLAPALSALSMCWLVRRWVSWAPAAFVAGLVYGFSLFALDSLANAHLMTGLLVVPPLLVGCFDGFLVRQRRRPAVVGVVLGLLVVVQYFVGVEMLLISAIAAAVGLVLLIAAGVIGDRAAVRRRLPGAALGLGTAAVVAVVALTTPLWFSLAGPGHLPSKVWPSIPSGYGGVALANIWRPPPPSSASVVLLQHQLGAYQGPALPNAEYLGLGLLVVVALGVVVWRRDRRLWLFTGLGLVALALSLGKETHAWVPWRVLAHLSLVENILPGRMMAVVDLCAAVLLGLVLDHLWHVDPGHGRRPPAALGTSAGADGARVDGAGGPGRPSPAARWLGPALAWAAALVAVVPTAAAMADNVPLTVVPVVLPQWFTEVAPHVPRGSVVLAFPVPWADQESSMTWQAVDDMHFSLAGSGDWEGRVDRAGKEAPGMALLATTSLSGSLQPAPTVADLGEVRQVLRGWGVTTVVVPDQPDLPGYERLARPSAVVGLITAATGQRPTYRAHAWVWEDVRSPGAALVVDAKAYEACVGPAPRVPGPPRTVPDCLLAAASGSSS